MEVILRWICGKGGSLVESSTPSRSLGAREGRRQPNRAQNETQINTTALNKILSILSTDTEGKKKIPLQEAKKKIFGTFSTSTCPKLEKDGFANFGGSSKIDVISLGGGEGEGVGALAGLR